MEMAQGEIRGRAAGGLPGHLALPTTPQETDLRRISALGAIVLLAACSADSPTSVQEGPGPLAVAFAPLDPVPVTLCKSWVDAVNPAPANPFAFTVTVDGGSSPVAVLADECVELGSFAPGSEMTITENLEPGYELEAIWRLSRTALDADGFPVTEILGNPDTPSTTFVVADFSRIFFKNSGFETPPPPPVDFAGCTPGFWRQSQHFPYWTGYAPTDLFSDVFGVDRDGTLLDNVWARGGGAGALARHAVAALLNAGSPEVEDPYTTAQIIAAVQGAFASGDFEGAKDGFEAANELGCTVDKSRD